MMTPKKLFLKRKDVPIQSLLDLKAANAEIVDAEVYRSNFRGTDPNTRSTKLKLIEPKDYHDINHHLLNMINVWDGSLDPNDYFVKEYNYLIYNKGDHFKKHRDVLSDPNEKSPRVFSTSTIISYSEDFSGGDFIIWSGDGYRDPVELEPGETIFFDSETYHQISPVKEGTREVLVAWIYKK